jgi:hypothetical protein
MAFNKSFFDLHTKLLRQRGSADVAGLAGFFVLLAGVPLLLGMLGGGGLLWAVTKEPEPTLTQRVAKERHKKELEVERLTLEARVPSDVGKVECRPTNDQLNLACTVTQTSGWGSSHSIKMPAVAGVPVVGFYYDARNENSEEALRFEGELSHRQRMMLFSAFPRVTK